MFVDVRRLRSASDSDISQTQTLFTYLYLVVITLLLHGLNSCSNSGHADRCRASGPSMDSDCNN